MRKVTNSLGDKEKARAQLLNTYSCTWDVVGTAESARGAEALGPECHQNPEAHLGLGHLLNPHWLICGEGMRRQNSAFP